MKRARKELCSSKLCLITAAIIVCLVNFVYYQSSADLSPSFELSNSFERDDAPSSLYGVCPLSRTDSSPPIIPKEKKKCKNEPPLTVLDKNGKIVVNKKVGEKIRKSCYARAFHNQPYWPSSWLKAIAVFFTRNDKLFWYNIEDSDKIDDDFVEVECLGYNNVHGRVVRREELKKRVNNTPDVYLVHVRSLKSNIFTPQTTRFLEEALGAVHFHNYQSLGDNFADFGAILAGGLATPLSRERLGWSKVATNLPRNYYDDPCFVTRAQSFLPKIIQQQGYATLIADENKVQESGFERGCGWEPSNFYLPVLHKFPPVAGCAYSNRVLDYFERFNSVYKDSAKFSILRILHDDGVVDEELLNVLTRLKSKFDNSYVVFIADVPGAANATPVPTPRQNLWISIPKKKRDSFSMVNLLSNQHALVSPFDVHSTLRAIIGLSIVSSGTSLIDKLPSTVVRDCLRLPIPLQHCPCQISLKNYTDSATLFEATETALEPLNSLLHHAGCKRWDISQIHAVRRIDSLPIVEIFVTARPMEANGFGHRYDRMDFPVLKLMAEEKQNADRSLAFTGLPEHSVALKPIDYSLSPCMKGHWLRPFCYCEGWKL